MFSWDDPPFFLSQDSHENINIIHIIHTILMNSHTITIPISPKKKHSTSNLMVKPLFLVITTIIHHY